MVGANKTNSHTPFTHIPPPPPPKPNPTPKITQSRNCLSGGENVLGQWGWCRWLFEFPFSAAFYDPLCFLGVSPRKWVCFFWEEDMKATCWVVSGYASGSAVWTSPVGRADTVWERWGPAHKNKDGWRSVFNHHCCFPWKITFHLGLEVQAKPVVHCLEDGCVKESSEWGQRLEWPRHQSAEVGWKVGAKLVAGQQGIPVHSLYWCPCCFVWLFQHANTKPWNFLCSSGGMTCRNSKVQLFFRL